MKTIDPFTRLLWRFGCVLLLAGIVASVLRAEDKPAPTVEQLQAQIQQLQQDLDQRTKLLNAYHKEFFACTEQAIAAQALALTPPRPHKPEAK